MKSSIFLGTWLLTFLVYPAIAQPAITMDKVMSGEQLKATGVVGLSPTQRAELDRWLSGYTIKLMQLAQDGGARGAGTVSYVGPSDGHWIKSKANDGTLITLEDGSMWEINSLDRIYTGLWLPISTVVVLKASSPVGDYAYTLVNTDDGSKALAKYLGKQ